VNRRHVMPPVLGLIDAASQEAGYWPVPAKPQAAPVAAGPEVHEPLDRPIPAPEPQTDDLDDPELSAV
jgi:hypothetical protein